MPKVGEIWFGKFYPHPVKVLSIISGEVRYQWITHDFLDFGTRDIDRWSYWFRRPNHMEYLRSGQ